MDNFSDMMAEGIVESSRFSDAQYQYPSLNKVKRDDGVMAEWFYPAINGQSDVSELKAILTYTTQNVVHEEIGNLILGVSFVEMQHYDKLSELIHKLGGRLRGAPNRITVEAGDTPKDALESAISAEQASIDFYRGIKERLEKVTATDTVKTVAKLMDKLIADETIHLDLFNKKLQEYEKTSD